MASNAVEVEVKEENLIKDEVSSNITDKDEDNQLTKTSEENGKGVEDLLTKREGFSSENFKIEVKNLPKYFGVGQMKKFLGKMQLKFHRLRPCGHKATWMFINFNCEEDREEAIAKLDGHRLKGMNLKAFKANAAKDPMLKKSESNEPVDTRPAHERILSVACPLGDKAYAEQLEAKTNDVKEVTEKLRKDFMKHNYFFKSHGIIEEDLAQLDEFIESPVVNGYRNKCEFTVGKHPETEETTVGFRLASYKRGSIAVVDIDHLPIVSSTMKSVAKHFQTFVRASGYEPYNNIAQTGHWKQLTVRESVRNDDLLVWAVIHPQDINEENKKTIKDALIQHFEKFEPKVTSLNIQFFGQRQKGKPEPPVECVQGKTFIEERLMDLTFKISPQAFFQINTEAAEKLFQQVSKIASLDKDTVLYDVCCGTGTIGLCLSSAVKEVHGVDIVEEAIKDANANAKANGVTNAEFHAGRAEFLLPELLKKSSDLKSVAIVDPPRAGLHAKAISALRSSNIETLVYVSCDAKAAMNNFIDLGRMTSNAYKGEPFVPKKIIPVDLFPHTKHFELIILFERYSLKEALKCE